MASTKCLERRVAVPAQGVIAIPEVVLQCTCYLQQGRREQTAVQNLVHFFEAPFACSEVHRRQPEEGEVTHRIAFCR
jgi:hypothetical protein